MGWFVDVKPFRLFDDIVSIKVFFVLIEVTDGISYMEEGQIKFIKL
jgi:hypothetical protein